MAGDEIADVRRFVHVPEEWSRRRAAAQTRSFVLGILSTVFFAGIALAAAITGVVSWSRRRFAPWLFVAGGGLMLAVSIVTGVNGWPMLLASLSTAQPLKLQVAALLGVGAVALTIAAAIVGLALGAIPHRLAAGASLPEREAARLAVAAGLVGAAVVTTGAWLRTPSWDRGLDLSALGTVVPILELAIDPIPTLLMRLAIVVTVLAGVDRVTAGWTRRRPTGSVVLIVLGVLAAGAPQGTGLLGWLGAGALTGAGLLAAYATLLRADLTMVPLALAMLAAVRVLAGGALRPFPGALAGSALGAALTVAVGWWWFRALRRYRQSATVSSPPAAV